MKVKFRNFKKWKKWQKILSFLGIMLFVIYIICPSQPKPPKSISSMTELETYMKKMTDYGTPPGMSLLIVRNNQIKYSKGFGWADEPKKIASSPETVYHWFSITKVVTAMCILQLEEKGKLKLEDQVIQYLPFFKVKYPSTTSKTITILDLLNHSSGLPNPQFDLFRWIHYEGEPAKNQTEMIKKVFPKYSKLIFEPGNHSEYSNIGYMILGAIIEEVTGQTYEDYVRQNILIPLEMKHTDFVYTKEMEPNIAAGAHPLYNYMSLLIPFIVKKSIRETHKNRIWFKRFYNDQTPPSGLIGPVTDVSRFMMAYLNKGELEGKRILSQESIKKMTTFGYMKRKDDNPKSYVRQGIAWLVFRKADNRLMFYHDGGGLAFNTFIQIFPEENLGLVLFTNVSECKGWKILDLAASLNW
jgi:D-alanyl-D-alanine carboxypeptidase